MTPDPSPYVVQRRAGGLWQYYRRVPTEVAAKIGKTHIKRSLKTRDHREALERATVIHRETNRLWAALAAGNDSATVYEQHRAAVARAQSLGFTYKPPGDIVREPAGTIAARTEAAYEARNTSVVTVQGAMGIAPEPKPIVSEMLTLYEENNRASLAGMSPGQLKAHRISRERAIKYVIEALGNVPLASITRRDALRFRDWWVDKIANEGLKAYSANRSFSDIKGMLTVIDVAMQSEYRAAWDGLRLKETNLTKLNKRSPFPIEWVRDRILAPGALDTMNDDARCIVYTMIDTGMRLGEVCNLRPQDIRLNHEVPHIEVADRTDRRQKTDYSIRQIPLVGVSLWAMKRHPNGYPRYADKANVASATINKALSAAGLRPTRSHTVYSLRHTFQDRIENAGASDRMQADLMGHEFGRPKYGDGAELARRRDFLESIKIDWVESD